MKLHELVPIDKRFHLFGEGPTFVLYDLAVIWVATHLGIAQAFVAGGLIGLALFAAYSYARGDEFNARRTAFSVPAGALYSMGVVYIALQFNIGAAVIIGGIAGAFLVEIFQAIAAEGTAEALDAVYGSVVPVIAGIVLGAVL